MGKAITHCKTDGGVKPTLHSWDNFLWMTNFKCPKYLNFKNILILTMVSHIVSMETHNASIENGVYLQNT